MSDRSDYDAKGECVKKVRMFRRLAVLSAGFLLCSVMRPAFAIGHAKPTVSEPTHALPAAKTVEQSIMINGHLLEYSVKLEALPVLSSSNQSNGYVVTMAYTVPSETPRPVAFVFNGGPGSGSGFLNLGAIGPKHLQFGAKGDTPSNPIVFKDNPGTWLDFTDLVFIDPIGTGFSRSNLDKDETKKAFWGIDQDAKYLARIVYDWLKKNERMASAKILVGESYGGFRVPRVAEELQIWDGVGPRGIVLISPYLDGGLSDTSLVSPMPMVIRLPSMAAANFEAQGIPLSAQRMAHVEEYVRDELPGAWLSGWTDPTALHEMEHKIADFTGLSDEVVARVGGRVDEGYFRRERFRSEGLVASIYDPSVTLPDPSPWATDGYIPDSVDSTFTAVSGGMTEMVTHVLGWKISGKYWAFNPEVVKDWYNQGVAPESVSALRRIMSADPRMEVFIAHGYSDLSCPYFASKLIVAQIPPRLANGRISLKLYPGGHMFYSRQSSGTQFKADARSVLGL